MHHPADPPAPALERQDLAWLLAGLLLIIFWDLSGLDWAVSSAIATPQGFPWREHPWARGAYELSRVGAGLLLLGLVMTALRMPAHGTGPRRSERWLWVGCVVACWLLVPAWKRASLTSCPWDQSAFGGVATLVSHWRWGVADGGHGRCFPSGHATTALAFLGQVVLWRRHDPVRARVWLVAVLVAGLAVGGLQVVRGAHYVSHVLWSAWGCWALLCLVAAAQGCRWRRGRQVPRFSPPRASSSR
jgi:membrane-associated PAP2 superfamily phosphatase